jgi:hypothetical protein
LTKEYVHEYSEGGEEEAKLNAPLHAMTNREKREQLQFALVDGNEWKILHGHALELLGPRP